MDVMEEAVEPLSQSLSAVRLLVRLPGNDSTESHLYRKTLSAQRLVRAQHEHTSLDATHRCEPAPPELTLSASFVAAEARDRLEPDWALLRLSAVKANTTVDYSNHIL